MIDYYEWFDPHQTRITADERPVAEHQAFNRGLGVGQAEMAQLLRSRAFQGMEIAAETLGRQMAYAPEIKQAVATVAAGLKQNAQIDVRIEERPDRRDKMVVMTCEVRPFRLNYGVVLEPEDLYRRAV